MAARAIKKVLLYKKTRNFMGKMHFCIFTAAQNVHLIKESILQTKPGVSNSVSYAGHILTKKGLRAALRGKMSLQAAIGGWKCLYTTKKTVVSAIE